MNVLVIGDPHATVGELDDCRRLFDLVDSHLADVDAVIILGDLHNNHDTTSVRVHAFWDEVFKSFHERIVPTYVLVGNHDQATPQDQYPHSLLPHAGKYPNVHIVDKPMQLWPGVCGMPYYHDPDAFVADAQRLADNTRALTLVAHQTFQGAAYENGFYAKDAIDLANVPFPQVLSGHIHAMQKCGCAIYPGSPRWRTAADVGDKFIFKMAFDDTGRIVKVKKIRTDTHCSRIYVLEDHPDAPVDLGNIPDDVRGHARIRVTVHGPDSAYLISRARTLRAQGVTVRTVPPAVRHAEVSERVGVKKAFSIFADAFRPPHGTRIERLKELVDERL